MKTILLIISLTFAPVLLTAQQDDVKIIYCELVSSQKPFGKGDKKFLSIDYGQGLEKMKDSDNLINTLNTLSKEGWEIVFVFVTTVNLASDYPDMHYILKKTLIE